MYKGELVIKITTSITSFTPVWDIYLASSLCKRYQFYLYYYRFEHAITGKSLLVSDILTDNLLILNFIHNNSIEFSNMISTYIFPCSGSYIPKANLRQILYQKE